MDLAPPSYVLHSPTAPTTWTQIAGVSGCLHLIGLTDGQPFGRWCKMVGLALRAWRVYFCLLCVYVTTDGVNNLISKRLRARLAWMATQVLNNEGELFAWPKLSLADSRSLFLSYTMASNAATLEHQEGMATLPTLRPRAAGGLAPIDLSDLEYSEESWASYERTCTFMDQ